jgi:type VII secretion-associated serine protease mycosin
VKVGSIVSRVTTAVVTCALVNVFGVSPVYADQPRSAQWYLKALHVDRAQRITKGAGVTVAVIDSGVLAKHQDLAGAVLPGRNVLGDGGDGRRDTVGHGTQMAGIIAARGRSGGRGVLGIAPAAEILPIVPAGDTGLVAEGINWSVAHGAKVISMSFGVIGSDALAAAVKAAAAADVVMIASSGNDGSEGSSDRYPAAYPQVLSVGAVDRNGKVAPFSSRGAEVRITAPGVDIAVADGEKPNAYVVVDGTSPATAIVSGAAALIRAKYPDLSAAEVVERLTSTATDKGPPGRDDSYGFGELDLMAALTAKQPTTNPSSSAPSSATATPPPAAQPDPDDSDSGIPPLLIIGVGLVLLVAAGVVLLVRVRKSRDA